MFRHGPLELAVFTDPVWQANSYLLWTPRREAWAVDPGYPPAGEQIADAVRRRALNLGAVLLTHGHLDHIAGLATLRREFPGVQIIAPAGEENMLSDPAANLSAIFGESLVAPPADRLLHAGDELRLGALDWRALDVSGHSPAGLAYYCPAAGVVLTGDALFAGGIGRTDFPGGGMKRLLANIRASLLTLPDGTVVYSGHGPPTTVADERAGNPFLDPRFHG